VTTGDRQFENVGAMRIRTANKIGIDNGFWRTRNESCKTASISFGGFTCPHVTT